MEEWDPAVCGYASSEWGCAPLMGCGSYSSYGYFGALLLLAAALPLLAAHQSPSLLLDTFTALKHPITPYNTV